jgi:hypothetical protein
MSARTATQQAKVPAPIKQFATDSVFDQIQQTLRETREEIKKRKTVYPDERM